MRPASVSAASVRALYRSYLRQVNILPHSYLRLFFRVKARQDIAPLYSSKAPTLRARDFETIARAVRKLERANTGEERAFLHVLDLAYGRKGKLKWELLNPILHPKGIKNEPIINGKTSSRPPVISKEIRALLISPVCRKGKPLEPRDLDYPRALPERANPDSEDARLFGPFSKRREVNIRKRFFNEETKKIHAPMSMIVNRPPSDSRPPREKGRLAVVKDDLERAVGPLCRGPTKTRRERASVPQEQLEDGRMAQRHPSRWVRRRFRALLSSIPELRYSSITGSPSVHSSPASFTGRPKPVHQMAEADPATLAWLELNEAKRTGQGLVIKRTKEDGTNNKAA